MEFELGDRPVCCQRFETSSAACGDGLKTASFKGEEQTASEARTRDAGEVRTIP
jgi:hypothetical protein